MVSFGNQITIARDPGAVFGYLADFTHVPQWNYWVREVTQLAPGPAGLGTVYHQVRRQDQQRYEIIDHERPRRLVVQTLTGDSPAFRRVLQLRPADRGTRLQDDWELDLGLPAVLAPLAARKVRRGVAANLAKLRELLEHGHTRLQDGRTVQLATT